MNIEKKMKINTINEASLKKFQSEILTVHSFEHAFY